LPKLHLTELSVRALKPSDQTTYWDTATSGFGIRVSKKSKAWTVMRGKSRERVTIGRYPDISLSDARAEAKKLLASEPEPKTVSISFKEASEAFLATYPENRWKLNLKTHFKKFKNLDNHKLSSLTDSEIERVIGRLKATPSAQLHAFRAMRTFLKWCTRPPRRYIRYSPMEGYQAPSTDRKGTRILTDDELKCIWEASGTDSRSVFRLLILWGTRNSETAQIAKNWLVRDVLTIPGSHTKNSRDHSIPILPIARSVLDSRPPGAFFFPGRYGDYRSINPMSLNRMRAEIQAESGTADWQARDIRRTFRSNMARLKVPREVCEVLINHAPPVLDEIYDRYDRLEEKREALAKYEAFMLALLAQGKT
jgi:intergrase/recombinase